MEKKGLYVLLFNKNLYNKNLIFLLVNVHTHTHTHARARARVCVYRNVIIIIYKNIKIII